MTMPGIFSRLLRTVPCGIAFSLLILPLAGAADAPVWSYHSPSKVRYMEVTPLGSLAVTSEAGLTVIDPANAASLWSRPDASGLVVIDDTPFGVAVVADRGEVVPLESGRTLWKFADKDVSGKEAFAAYPQSKLVILSDYSGQAPMLVGVDLESGAVRWKQPAAVDSAVAARVGTSRSFALWPYHPPLQDTDSTIVIYPTQGGPIRLHLGTGQVLWRARDWGERDGPTSSFMGVPPPPVIRDGDLLLVAYGRRVLALSVDDGHLVWDHAEKFQSEVVQMEACAQGLLVGGQGKPFLRMLDRTTGHERWVVPFKTLAPVSPFVVRGDKAYAADTKSLAEVTLATGETRRVAPFKFEGHELPSVEVSDTGFLLGSSQNLCSIDSTGTERYHLYLKAPGASLFAKIASSTLFMAFNVASVGLAGPVAPVISSNPTLTMRYHASFAARNYAYIFTGEPDSAGRKGFSLVRIDKRTGVEAGRLWVGERSPNFQLDPITATLYLVHDDTEISALRY